MKNLLTAEQLEKLHAELNRNRELILAMPDFVYEISDEFGRRITFTETSKENQDD